MSFRRCENVGFPSKVKKKKRRSPSHNILLLLFKPFDSPILLSIIKKKKDITTKYKNNPNPFIIIDTSILLL